MSASEWRKSPLIAAARRQRVRQASRQRRRRPSAFDDASAPRRTCSASAASVAPERRRGHLRQPKRHPTAAPPAAAGCRTSDTCGQRHCIAPRPPTPPAPHEHGLLVPRRGLHVRPDAAAARRRRLRPQLDRAQRGGLLHVLDLTSHSDSVSHVTAHVLAARSRPSRVHPQ